MDNEVDDLPYPAYQRRLNSGLLASFTLSHCSLKSHKKTLKAPFSTSRVWTGGGGGGGGGGGVGWGTNVSCQLTF